MKLSWEPVKGIKGEAGVRVKCDNCNVTSSFHPNFVDAKLTICTREGCNDLIAVAKRMAEYRGWKIIELNYAKHILKSRVKFTCQNGHESVISYENLQLGVNCKNCRRNELGKLKVKVTKDLLKTCSCKRRYCEHYNFAVMCPIGALEWDYVKNTILPENIAPLSADKRWFICSVPGCGASFEKIPARRMEGYGCPVCSGKQVSESTCVATTHPHLVKECHPDDVTKLSEFSYGSHTKLKWICKKHDNDFIWEASIKCRVNQDGCPKCAFPYSAKHGGYQTFIREAIAMHGNRYKYCSEKQYLIEFANNPDAPKMPIECSEHGIFRQALHTHLSGAGCLACTKRGRALIGGHAYFVEKARLVHGDKYSYPEEYIDSVTKITILCPTHGEFKQLSGDHTGGHGCPKCGKYANGDVLRIEELLNSAGIKFTREVKFDDLKDVKLLAFDFRLDEVPMLVEKDGEQHFRVVEFWGGEDAWRKRVYHDVLKDMYCVKNKISLWRIPYWQTVTIQDFVKMIERAKKGQIYVSYQNYKDMIEDCVDFTGVDVEIVTKPTKN